MYFKKENQKSPDLQIKDFARIQEIFELKKWPIEDYFSDSVFENFCNMLADLEPEQCNLVINLTEKFLWVQDSAYIKHFSGAFDSFISSFNFSRGKNIYMITTYRLFLLQNIFLCSLVLNINIFAIWHTLQTVSIGIFLFQKVTDKLEILMNHYLI